MLQALKEEISKISKGQINSLEKLNLYNIIKPMLEKQYEM